jgi:hypothetical protein
LHPASPLLHRQRNGLRISEQRLRVRQKGLNERETAFAIKISERLVREYHALLDEFRKENIVLESILQYVGKEL